MLAGQNILYARYFRTSADNLMVNMNKHDDVKHYLHGSSFLDVAIEENPSCHTIVRALPCCLSRPLLPHLKVFLRCCLIAVATERDILFDKCSKLPMDGFI